MQPIVVGPDLFSGVEVVQYLAVAEDDAALSHLVNVALGVQVDVAIAAEADERSCPVANDERPVVRDLNFNLVQ